MDPDLARCKPTHLHVVNLLGVLLQAPPDEHLGRPIMVGTVPTGDAWEEEEEGGRRGGGGEQRAGGRREGGGGGGGDQRSIACWSPPPPYPSPTHTCIIEGGGVLNHDSAPWPRPPLAPPSPPPSQLPPHSTLPAS